MNYFVTQSTLVFIVLFNACSPVQTVEQAPDFQKLDAEVREMFTWSMELFQNNDLDGLVDRFTEDGTLKITGATLIEGKEALRSNYEKNLELEEFNIDLQVLKVDIAEKGDMASAIAEYSVSFITPGGPFKDKGITLMVLKRENDKWKIAAENLSSNPIELLPVE
jgi:ketosteroid isomerase-like protein